MHTPHNISTIPPLLDNGKVDWAFYAAQPLHYFASLIIPATEWQIQDERFTLHSSTYGHVKTTDDLQGYEFSGCFATCVVCAIQHMSFPDWVQTVRDGEGIFDRQRIAYWNAPYRASQPLLYMVDCLRVGHLYDASRNLNRFRKECANLLNTKTVPYVYKGHPSLNVDMHSLFHTSKQFPGNNSYFEGYVHALQKYDL